MSERVSHSVFARMWERAAAASIKHGAEEHRKRLLEGLSGRVVEVGAGQGTNFPYYPGSVEEVVAVEPEDYLREKARSAPAPVPVSVLDGVAEKLPFADGSFDAGVVALVLCSVRDQSLALAELRRVIKPGGELRFYEHVVSPGGVGGRLQRLADATLWPRAFGGCHLSRDTEAGILRAGFELESRERFAFSPTPPVSLPHILGVARRP